MGRKSFVVVVLKHMKNVINPRWLLEATRGMLPSDHGPQPHAIASMPRHRPSTAWSGTFRSAHTSVCGNRKNKVEGGQEVGGKAPAMRGS